MEAQISGEVYKLYDQQVISQKFSKREVVIKTSDGQYYPIQFTNKNIPKLDRTRIGDNVLVSCNITGREWIDKSNKEKFFLAIDGQSISVI